MQHDKKGLYNCTFPGHESFEKHSPSSNAKTPQRIKEFARYKVWGCCLENYTRSKKMGNVNKPFCGSNVGINSGNLVQNRLQVAENILHLYDLVVKS